MASPTALIVVAGSSWAGVGSGMTSSTRPKERRSGAVTRIAAAASGARAASFRECSWPPGGDGIDEFSSMSTVSDAVASAPPLRPPMTTEMIGVSSVP